MRTEVEGLDLDALEKVARDYIDKGMPTYPVAGPGVVLALIAALRAQAERVRVLEGEAERAKAFINGDLKANFIQQADAVAANLPWKVKATEAEARAEAAERRAGELEGALRLAEGRLEMLLPAELPNSDHPTATNYVLSRVRALLSPATSPGEGA